MATERVLEAEKVEGEISLVIDYEPGRMVAVDVLRGAMALIESLDRLDRALLSSVDTSLEPVSVLNDVVHSSLKMMLARALKKVPDRHLNSLDWKKWAGELLVTGKYLLLRRLEDGVVDAPEVQEVLDVLEPHYRQAPAGLIGYSAPRVTEVKAALEDVADARAKLSGQKVTIQTELGDVSLPDVGALVADTLLGVAEITRANTGTEFFKVKSVDLLGNSQWTVLRNGRQVRVDMLHQRWLDEFHQRKFSILPGDSIECRYEETIEYDGDHNEIARHLAIIEVLRVITPPTQQPLLPHEPA